jgi:Protein of Unknown function (DUF2784)
MSPLTAHVLATLVVAAHVAFIVFVVIGGLFVLRWRKLLYPHLAAVIWAVYIEWSGSVCPLTPLEKTLRAAAGLEAYTGDFVAEYVFPVLYPDGLTRRAQLVIGAAVVAVNGCVYSWLLRQRKSNTFVS